MRKAIKWILSKLFPAPDRGATTEWLARLEELNIVPKRAQQKNEDEETFLLTAAS